MCVCVSYTNVYMCCGCIIKVKIVKQTSPSACSNIKNISNGSVVQTGSGLRD